MPSIFHNPWFLYFDTAETRASPSATIAQEDKIAARYVCGACQHLICDQHARTTFGDCFEHTFFNPHGLLFRIGCFTQAPGVAVHGSPSDEFSWFPGYFWQAGTCHKCDQHLGWYFTGSGSPFFGLILPRLVFCQS